MIRTFAPSSVRFDLTAHRAPSATQLRTLQEAAALYGDFLGRSTQVNVA